jgi:Fic family protein
MKELYILRYDFFEAYLAGLAGHAVPTLPEAAPLVFTNDTFGFYTSVASVYSSKIEGETIELDSYLKHRFQNISYRPDYTKKTDDLFSAYAFARDNRLHFRNVLKAHAKITKNFLSAPLRGRIRTHPELIIDKNGQIEYVAADPGIVQAETDKLFHDIQFLLESDLSAEQVFYFASFIHLVLLKIHPSADGNGRTSRLLEKWFLAEKLGQNAWFIPSERYYYTHLAAYYKNVHLGTAYETVRYDGCLPLLWMLPKALSE